MIRAPLLFALASLAPAFAACKTTRGAADAAADAAPEAGDAAARCFPGPRGFDPAYREGSVTLSMTPVAVAAIAEGGAGRLIAAGAQGSDTYVTRLDAIGKIDATFGAMGAFTQSFSADADGAAAVALDATGRVIVAGSLVQGGSTYPWVARLGQDGALDATFAAGGAIPGAWIGSVSLGGVTVLATDGGAVYAAGAGFLLRLAEDGTPDAAFPLVSGMGVPSFAAAVTLADGVALLSKDGALAKWSKSGVRDASFGGALLQTSAASALVPNGDGFLAADGADPSRVAAADSHGALVATFGTAGVSAAISSRVTSLGVACDRIVLGGGTNGAARVALLGADGRPAGGDPAPASYPVAVPADAGAGPLLSTVLADGRVVFLVSVAGTGAVEIARVSP